MLDRMALKLIVGPPNSGRTGAVLDGFRAAFGRDPVLVVPTVDDVERFEEGISEERALDLVLEWLSPPRVMELCREATELYMWDRYGSDN